MKKKLSKENPLLPLLNHPRIKELLSSIKMSELGLSSFLQKVNQVLISIASEFSIEPEQIRILNQKALSRIMSDLAPGSLLIMRHGEQKTAPSLAHFDSASRKIKMMQKEHNEKDTITKNSAFEFLSTLFVFSYIKSQKKVDFHIESSQNPRAAHLSEALAYVLNTKVNFKQYWNCINYPDDTLLKEKNLADHLINGKLPWKREHVDAIAGREKYNEISSNMKNVLKWAVQRNAVTISISHSQQISAANEIGKLPISRYTNHGFSHFHKTQSAQSFPDGFYQPDVTLRKKKKVNPSPRFHVSANSAHEDSKEKTGIHFKI